MKPSAIETQYARALILWPERRLSGVGARSGEGKASATAVTARRNPFFRNLLSKWTQGISDDDIEMGLGRYLKRRPWLEHWYEDVLSPEGIDVRWFDAQPVIDATGASTWFTLLNFMDEDALLCFDFAKKHREYDGEELTRHFKNWRTIARCGDFELDAITSRGLSDLHVHAGGVRLQQSVWLQLMDSAGAWRRFPSLRVAYDEDVHDGEARRASASASFGTGAALDPSLRAAAAAASAARKSLCRSLQLPTPVREHPETRGDHWIAWSYKALVHERTLLIRAWRHVLETRSPTFYSQLDAYLAAKNRFARLCRQPMFEPNVGLKFFNDRYFRRLETKRERTSSQDLSQFRQSHRFTMEPIANASAFLMESQSLHRVELRIAPLPRARDYWRFFSLWNRFYNEQLTPWAAQNGQTPIKIGFAVHFKRTAPRQMPNTAATVARNEMLLRDLDRATVELRMALSCPRNGGKLSALRRIDIAGNERDAVSSNFALHVPLLRGDPDAYRLLESPPSQANRAPLWERYLTHWRRAHALGRSRPGPSDRRLGLTIHAGEDFADQLEGLYQIAGAVIACRMVAGDGIGHGLALSPNASLRGRTTPPSAMTTISHALGALCWLFVQSDQDPSAAHDETLYLRRQIELLSHSAFQSEVTPPCEVVVTAWRLAFQPHERFLNTPYFKAALALLAQLADHPASGAQLEQTIYLDRHERLQGLIEKARKKLVADIIRRRIVVEMNPSSNARISGAVRPEQSPTADLLGMIADGLIATVNTDNPGVFSTCIENEYAVLMDSARQAGMGEGQIRELLERARMFGAERVYWRE